MSEIEDEDEDEDEDDDDCRWGVCPMGLFPKADLSAESSSAPPG
jgi:hypothetical protein